MTQEIMNIKEEVRKIIRDEITKEVQRDSYQKGFDDALDSECKKWKDAFNTGYEEGLNDAWEAARWVNEANTDDIVSVFGSTMEAYKLSSVEVVDLINKYKKEKENAKRKS